MIRAAARWLLSLFYLAAGVLHLLIPGPFLQIMPAWVPTPHFVVLATGMAEICGAIGLAQPFSPRLRRVAAIGLALYAVCIFPANIQHFAMDMARSDGGLGLGYHLPRMIAQPVIVWLALWAGEATDWPFPRRTG